MARQHFKCPADEQCHQNTCKYVQGLFRCGGRDCPFERVSAGSTVLDLAPTQLNRPAGYVGGNMLSVVRQVCRFLNKCPRSDLRESIGMTAMETFGIFFLWLRPH